MILLNFGNSKQKKGIISINNAYLNILNAICIGFFIQIFLLNMNQNVLRPYVWINLSVLSVVYKGIRIFSTDI